MYIYYDKLFLINDRAFRFMVEMMVFGTHHRQEPKKNIGTSPKLFPTNTLWRGTLNNETRYNHQPPDTHTYNSIGRAREGEKMLFNAANDDDGEIWKIILLIVMDF
jgi:hypothetical protein